MRPCYCVQAINTSALFLTITYESALLLAADQPPLLRVLREYVDTIDVLHACVFDRKGYYYDAERDLLAIAQSLVLFLVAASFTRKRCVSPISTTVAGIYCVMCRIFKRTVFIPRCNGLL